MQYENQQTESQKAKRGSSRPTYINYNIRGYKVKVLDDEHGHRFMSTSEAIAMAQARGLDLVQISFDKENRLPICKVLDYGKYKYEQSKREKNAKKQARANAVDVKTVQFSITTDDNDKARLLKQAQQFLAEGDNVKLTIRFRNKRESKNLDFAKDVMKSLLASFNGLATLDSTPALGGRELACILRPTKK